MSVAVRLFERRDRDQLTALVNLHVAAVIPGVVLSVNTVLAQLEREPDETIVDPWVDERCCLVVERGHELVASALLHRFRTGLDVGPEYRGSGEVRWLICKRDATDAGAIVVGAALEQMKRWEVTVVGAECALPALACYGVPDTLPHIRKLLVDAGFGEPTRTEMVLAARCDALAGHALEGSSIERTLGLLGARFTLRLEDADLGFIEVSDQSSAMARSSVATRWADVGNLSLADDGYLDIAMAPLLSAAADWLLLGGVNRLVDYWAADTHQPEYLAQLERLGFQRLVVNERGFQRPI
jgi:hypothetical protein